MKAREAIYLVGSFVLSPILHFEGIIRFLSLFSFERDRGDDLDRTIKVWLKRFGWIIYLATVLILFVGNAIWSFFNGRLFPDSNPATVQFFEDWPNMINYTVICPLYVMLCLCFLFHINRLRSSLHDAGLYRALCVEPKPLKMTGRRAVFLAALGLFVSIFTIANFAGELGKYTDFYWFQTLGKGGDRLLSTHGLYYLLTNFILNMIVVATVAMHFELFAVASKIGKRLEDLCNSDKTTIPHELLSQQKLPAMLAPFSALYLVSKGIVIILLANMYTWRAQELQFFSMLDWSVVLLGLLGAAVVSYPRYHIQYWIFRVWRKHEQHEYPEIRGPVIAGLASIADVLILGTAMTNLIYEVFEHSGINLEIF